MRYALERALQQHQIVRAKDLMARGMSRDHITAAVAAGLIVKPYADTAAGAIHGLYATPEAMEHPSVDEAIAMVLTNGVFGRQYAAMRHGLATCLPPRHEIIVPTSIQGVPKRVDYRLYRSRKPESLSVGVETVDVVAGVEIRFTNRARTTIDLIRAKRTNSDDWRHGIEALNTYLEEGGAVADLVEVAGHFEEWLPDTLDDLVAGIMDSNARGFGR